MNADKSAAIERQEECQWLACRYILGEMSSAEADAFEQLLATDQEAREILARATGLVAELYCAEKTAARDTAARDTVAPVRCTNASELETLRPAKRQQRRTVSLAAAVAVVVGIGLYLAPVGNRTFIGSNGLESADDETGDLIAIWSERLSESEPAVVDRAARLASSGEEGADSANPIENARIDLPADSDLLASASDTVPGWMLAAVANGTAANGDAWNADGQTPEVWEN